jgi:hypothetical protein
VIRRVLFTAALLAAPKVALACPVCFGQTDSPLARATTLGVIAMLGVVVAILSGFAAFIVYLNRRARLFADVEAAPMWSGSPALPRTNPNPHEGTAQC